MNLLLAKADPRELLAVITVAALQELRGALHGIDDADGIRLIRMPQAAAF